jgi:hypothetical protein
MRNGYSPPLAAAVDIYDFDRDHDIACEDLPLGRLP